MDEDVGESGDVVGVDADAFVDGRSSVHVCKEIARFPNRFFARESVQDVAEESSKTLLHDPLWSVEMIFVSIVEPEIDEVI